MTVTLNNAAFYLNGIKKVYTSRDGTDITALDGVSFEAAVGKITCLIGPTGSGKSTILRVVAGLEAADSGTAMIDGALPAEVRGRIGYLTQRHTLFPWMTVADNIGLPLEVQGVAAKDRTSRIGVICEMLGLENAKELYPYELSGGMQQRAALGRLLLSESPYWLMDEPFNALDERTRHQLQRLLIRLVAENGMSVLFVTHSIDEAVYLSDRIVVLSSSPGRVVEPLEPEIAHPRDRLSPDYGRFIERVRQSMESVIKEME